MDILINSNNLIIASAPKIKFGIFDEPDIEKWGLFDENDNVLYYYIDSNFKLFTDVEDIPDDLQDYKYNYIDGKFVMNGEWKPFVSPEQQTEINTEDINSILNLCGDLMYEQSLIKLGL